MTRTKRPLVALVMICFAGGVALAQQKVPPPPKPPDDGPSLEVTMKFIQDKLNGMGPINYVEHVHDDDHDLNWSSENKFEFSIVEAKPQSCTVNFHLTEVSGGSSFGADYAIPLKTVEKIIVMPVEQLLKESNPQTGHPHPEWSYRVDPPVFVLKAVGSDKSSNLLYFLDEDLSNRVAKAMVHAVELCGGGNKDPF